MLVNCKNRYRKDADKSFYRFPVDPYQRVKWEAAVNRRIGVLLSTVVSVVTILLPVS